MELLQLVFKYLNIVLLIVIVLVIIVLLFKMAKLSKSINLTSTKKDKINKEIDAMKNKVADLDNRAYQKLPTLITINAAIELIIAIFDNRKRSKQQKKPLVSSVAKVLVQNPKDVAYVVDGIKKL